MLWLSLPPWPSFLLLSWVCYSWPSQLLHSVCVHWPLLLTYSALISIVLNSWHLSFISPFSFLHHRPSKKFYISVDVTFKDQEFYFITPYLQGKNSAMEDKDMGDSFLICHHYPYLHQFHHHFPPCRILGLYPSPCRILCLNPCSEILKKKTPLLLRM